MNQGIRSKTAYLAWYVHHANTHPKWIKECSIECDSPRLEDGPEAQKMSSCVGLREPSEVTS